MGTVDISPFFIFLADPLERLVPLFLLVLVFSLPLVSLVCKLMMWKKIVLDQLAVQ
jgi:hypothetical protein